MPPDVVETIIKETKVKATKAEIIKAWAPIITSIVALASAVIVALISASSAKVDNIAQRLDEKVIPKLEETLTNHDRLITELVVYKEIFEKEIDKLKNKHIASGPIEPISVEISAAKKAAPKPAKFELPRVQLEQRILPEEFPRDVAAEK